MEAGRDTNAVEMVLSHNEYRAGLRQRSVPFDVYAGYDHEGLNHSLDIALPPATEWLSSQPNQLNLYDRHGTQRQQRALRQRGRG